jgi:hypothetical protein
MDGQLVSGKGMLSTIERLVADATVAVAPQVTRLWRREQSVGE